MSWWLPALPLLGAVIGLSIGRRSRGAAALVAVAGPAAALVLAVWVMATRSPWVEPITSDLGSIPTGFTPVALVTSIDGLAGSVAVMVGVVATLVQVYSIEYLRDDPRYSSYAAVVSLFTAAMFLVVVAGDLLVLLVGWEVMGLCSYLLIGHHWEDRVARAAAVKAFLVTRTGDVGLLLGILVLGAAVGSFQIADVLAAVSGLDATTLLAAGLLIGAAVVGKSAQFPLHTWLPDAMAGPTPISALIHAATMVAAGIYLVARLYPLYLATPQVLQVLAVLAVIGMVGAALAALAADDIKRVLAYSTISQLAYMLAALGVGSSDAAVFHLISHAAFKALLFLAAGSVIHAVATNSMAAMGGLGRRMPVTATTMAVGLAALVGIPPLAGFFSKESVLAAAEYAIEGEAVVATWTGWMVLIAGLVTVVITGAYATRLFLRTFAGQYRGAAQPHESGALMTLPLVILAVPSIGLGFLALRAEWLPTWITGPGSEEIKAFAPEAALGLLSTVLAILGAGVMAGAWARNRAADPSRSLRLDGPVLQHAFYVDNFYDATVVRPIRALARAVLRTEDSVVDAAVEGAGSAGWSAGGAIRQTQNGNVQRSLLGVLAGAGAVLLVAAAAALLAGAA